MGDEIDNTEVVYAWADLSWVYPHDLGDALGYKSDDYVKLTVDLSNLESWEYEDEIDCAVARYFIH